MATVSLPAQVSRTRRFTFGAPGRFTIGLNGSPVLYLRSRAGDDPVTCLWALDPASGTEWLLADPAELRGPHSTGSGAGIGAYATDAAAGLVTFALGGGLWTVEVPGGRARRLPAREPVVAPRPEPAGRRIAYTSAGGLRVIEADGSDDRTIATPDGPNVSFGVVEEAGAVALRSPWGFWWAPEGDRLLVARVDSTRVGVWYLADPAQPHRAPRAMRYPAAGTANAEVTLWIAGLDGSRTRVWWDLDRFEYVSDAGWDSHGPYVVVQSRDQRTVRFLEIDPASGGTTVRHEQRDGCWVQLVPGLPTRTGSGVLLTHTDLRGTRHLSVDDTVVTPPGLQLRAVLAVDGEQVLFTASDEPTETHLWSYQPGEGLRRLSGQPGVHSGVGRGGTLVHVAERPDRPGGLATVTRQGHPPVTVRSLVERPVLDVRAIPLVLGPRDLRASLHLPSWYRRGDAALPVLLDPYGGASRQRATAALDWRSLVSQWLAEQGFAVLVADGRGTPGRGPAWEREIYGDQLGPAVDDQVTALHEAARRHPELDLGRVGIRGWSFGGTLAAAAVLRRPDVFHAAVAGAAVTDHRLHNTHWRERFMGHPDEYPERYEASSLLRAAPTLARPLLLMHGLADDNVHVTNTLRLSSALLAAGRPHEVLLLPGLGHQAIGSEATENLLWHQVRFLQRHLGEAPRQRPPVRGNDGEKP